MKQQNDHNKTKYYSAYTDSKPTHVRIKEAIDSIPKHCWWLKQYLRGCDYAHRKVNNDKF